MKNERREHERVEIEGDVLVYYKAGKSLVTIADEASLKDVSAGGAEISSPVPYPISFPVNMNIDLPGGPVKMQGSVIRIEQVAGSETFDIGIKFYGLAESDVQRLTQFIAEHMQGKGGTPPASDTPKDSSHT